MEKRAVGAGVRSMLSLRLAPCLLLLTACTHVLLLAYPAQEAREDDLRNLYDQARTAEASGDLKTATQKYERIVTLRPDLGEAYANLGKLYFEQQQSEQAARCLKRAIQLKPELAGPYFFLGALAYNDRRYDEAFKYLTRAATLDHSESATTLYLGYTEYARFHYLEAVRDFAQVAKVQPDDPNVLYYLSRSYGQAAKHFFGLLKRDFPDSFYTHLARAHVYEAQSQWKDAKTEYTLVLGQQPQSRRLKQRLTWVSQNGAGDPPPKALGSEEEAIDGSLKFLHTPPDAIQVRDELRRYQGLVEQHHASASADRVYSLAEDYQILSYLASLRVFEVEPESYRAHQLKAQYYAELGKDDEAIQEYRLAARLEPDLPDVHFEIGNLYWKRNRIEQALPELKQELNIQPNHPEALYEAADVLYAQGKLQEAEQCLLKTLKVKPAMVEAHLALERVYTATNRYNEALAELERVTKLAPNDPTPHYRMSAVLRKMGKQDQAQKELAIFANLRSKSGRQ